MPPLTIGLSLGFQGFRVLGFGGLGVLGLGLQLRVPRKLFYVLSHAIFNH